MAARCQSTSKEKFTKDLKHSVFLIAESQKDLASRLGATEVDLGKLQLRTEDIGDKVDSILKLLTAKPAASTSLRAGEVGGFFGSISGGAPAGVEARVGGDPIPRPGSASVPRPTSIAPRFW